MKIVPFCFSLLLAVALLATCKPREVVVTQTETKRVTDTLHQVTHIRDSLYLHDSVFIVRNAIADTIYETKYVYKYKYRDRMGQDSIRVIHNTDTVKIVEPDLHAIKALETETELYKNKASKWKFGFYGLVAVFIGLLVYWIYRKLKP